METERVTRYSGDSDGMWMIFSQVEVGDIEGNGIKSGQVTLLYGHTYMGMHVLYQHYIRITFQLLYSYNTHPAVPSNYTAFFPKKVHFTLGLIPELYRIRLDNSIGSLICLVD